MPTPSRRTRPRINAVVGVVAAAAVSLACRTPTDSGAAFRPPPLVPTAFVNASVVSLDPPGILANKTVITREGRIIAVGDAAGIVIPADVRRDGARRVGAATMRSVVLRVLVRSSPDVPLARFRDIAHIVRDAARRVPPSVSSPLLLERAAFCLPGARLHL